jgi:methylmalonyl-CoA carboxyltransferase large subunit
MNLTDFVLIVALVGVGSALSFAGLWMMLRVIISERQQETESQLSLLTSTLKALEARVAELSRPAGTQEAADPAAAKEAVPADDEQVTPDMLVVIAAAVTAYLGKKVRIRSAKMLRPTRAGVGAWSQQGRVLVHGSHSLRSRG